MSETCAEMSLELVVNGVGGTAAAGARGVARRPGSTSSRVSLFPTTRGGSWCQSVARETYTGHVRTCPNIQDPG